jgi:hypothetical protein
MKAFRIIFTSLLFLTLGCGSDSNTLTRTKTRTAQTTPINLCGFELNGELLNLKKSPPMTPISIEAISEGDLLVKRPTSTEQSPFMVRISGIKVKKLSSGQRALLNKIISENSHGLSLVEDIQSCTTDETTNNEIIVAQFITSTGRNLSELLLEQGLAVASPDQCGHPVLGACLSALPISEPTSDQVITKIFWNPSSESDGKLEILTDAFNVQIQIKGEISSRSKMNEGQSRGYNSTARFNYPGCAYGASKLFFFDEFDRPIYLGDGSHFVRVSQSCEKRTFSF